MTRPIIGPGVWDLFDFGKRRAAVREREAQLAQAEENLHRLKEEVAVGIERSYNKLERTRNLVQVANQVVKLRWPRAWCWCPKGGKLLPPVTKRRRTFLHASLGYLLAWAELEQAVGRTPGF